MEIDPRFPTELDAVSDAPEPLQVHGARGGGKLGIIFPSDDEKVVSKAMERMIRFFALGVLTQGEIRASHFPGDRHRVY